MSFKGIEYEISVQDVMIENYQDALASGEFSGSSKVAIEQELRRVQEHRRALCEQLEAPKSGKTDLEKVKQEPRSTAPQGPPIQGPPPQSLPPQGLPPQGPPPGPSTQGPPPQGPPPQGPQSYTQVISKPASKALPPTNLGRVQATDEVIRKMGFTYSPFGRAKAGEQALKYHGKYLVDKWPPTFQNLEFTYLKGQHKDGDGQVGPHKLGLDRKHNLLLCYADMATYKGCSFGKDCELRHEDLSNEELAIIAKTEVGREWIKHVYMKYNETVDEKIKGGGGFPKAAEPSDDPAVQKALEEWKAKHIETLLSDRNPQ